ncbi:hypothetical protein ACIBG0_03565 [Nocardia sp. NPDC050630]|uniref:hypothetical protein n=1 Tax=Nocardia sp. NPDC050630 TaxID=3364321 RepID=UPI00378FAC18
MPQLDIHASSVYMAHSKHFAGFSVENAVGSCAVLCSMATNRWTPATVLVLAQCASSALPDEDHVGAIFAAPLFGVTFHGDLHARDPDRHRIDRIGPRRH